MNSDTVKYCGSKPPDWSKFNAKYTPEFFRQARTEDTQQTLYVQVRYVVLYQTELEKVSMERIRDAHKSLNVIYRGENTQDLAKIPTSKNCPFKQWLGTPNIQFLPLDETQLTAVEFSDLTTDLNVVRYLKVDSGLNANQPVDDASQRGGIVNGVLNIYIGATSGNSPILGQAELGSNIVYVLHLTVGGDKVRGLIAQYDRGRTLVHEVGHALSLVHTFYDDACDNAGPYSDNPEQIQPNFNGRVFFNEETKEWDCDGDNRSRDLVQSVPGRSCLGFIQSKLSTIPASERPDIPFENFTNIMDYGTDNVSFMFSQNQCTQMREYLTSSQNTALKLMDAPASVAAVSSEPAPALTTVDPTPTPTPTPTETSPVVSPVSGTMDTWLILLIVAIVVLLFIGVLAWVAVRKTQHTRDLSTKNH